MPRTLDGVGGYRVTRGAYEDGEELVLSDYWMASKRPERCPEKKRKGSTEFLPGPVQDASPSFGEVEGPARGHSTDPAGAEEALRPLESHTTSARKYYAPIEVQEEETTPGKSAVPEVTAWVIMAARRDKESDRRMTAS